MRNGMGKLVLLLLVSCMVGALLPGTMVEATMEIVTEGNYEYTVLEDNTVEIKKYMGSETEVTIPATLGGKKVTSIGEMAFNDCLELKNVTIPDSVTSIQDYAFQGCSALRIIAIPDSVTSIQDYAFSSCSSLISVTIPASVTDIGCNPFARCSELASIVVDTGNTVYDSRNNCNAIIEKETNRLISGCKKTTIPESVLGIGDSAFEGCLGLTNVTIPENVVYIGNNPFAACVGLISVTIPKSVVYIGKNPFVDCSELISISVDTGNTTYDSRNNCNAIIETGRNKLISGCKATVIPESVTSIWGEAFKGSSKLTTIVIPSGVKEIVGNPFCRCSGLTSIVVDADNEIYDSRNNCNAIIETRTNKLISGCESTIIPSNVISIEDEAFYGCTGLKSIVIPDSVQSIEGSAFAICSSLENIEIPASVTDIGNCAFLGCSSLTKVIIQGSVTRLDLYTFAKCSSLTSMVILGEIREGIVTNGWDEIFQEVYFDYPENTVIYGYLGSNVPLLAELMGVTFKENKWSYTTLKDGTLKITGYPFTAIDSDGLLSIPNTIDGKKVTVLGESLFENQLDIVTVEIGEGVREIESRCFYNCSALTEVVLPTSLETLASDAFEGVENDTTKLQITIPEKMEDVSNLGIENVANIQNITIYVVAGGQAEVYLQQFDNVIVNTYQPQQTPLKDNETTEQVTEVEKTEIGKTYTVKGLKYKVTSSKNVTIVGASKKNVKKVTIPSKVKILGKSFKVTAVGKKSFKKYTKLTTVVIGSDVKTIGDEAFRNCSKLKKVTIGKNVKTIGKKAFYGDKKLMRIIFKGTKVTKIGKKALKGVPRAKVTVPDKVKKKYTKLLNKAR